jgi:hypothetical protein
LTDPGRRRFMHTFDGHQVAEILPIDGVWQLLIA